MRQNDYLQIISHVQMHASKKDLFFIIRATGKGLALLALLEKLSVIRNYYDLGSGNYRVFLFYSRNYKTKRQLRLYARKTNDLQLSLASLRMLNFLTPSSYFVVETHKGLMTHKEALMGRMGGKLIAVVL